MCDFATTDVPASPHLCLHLDIVIPLQLKRKMWEKETCKFQELRGGQEHVCQVIRELWDERCCESYRAVPFTFEKINLHHTHTPTPSPWYQWNTPETTKIQENGSYKKHFFSFAFYKLAL